MKVRMAVSAAYLAVMTMLLGPIEGLAQSPPDSGLVPGVTVNVRYIWFRDSGAAGGGFWLTTTGQVVSVSDQYVVLNVGGNRQAIAWGDIGYIDRVCPDCITWHHLQVSRFTTSRLTDKDADDVLAAATTVVSVSDVAGDVACPVTFIRDGSVTAFTQGSGTINSQADFNAVIGLPGWVKVVNQINWCGALVPNVIGCSPTPGNSMAVVRWAPTVQEGILWAHEFGHDKGLNHRNDPNAIMNPTIGYTELGVNAQECAAYRTLPFIETAAGPPQAQTDNGAPLRDVRAFVRQVFIHGLPYKEAGLYQASAIPPLLAMLQDPTESDSWANVAVLLGMIGDERVVEPLISFIQAEPGPTGLSAARYRAKTSALMALGYLVNRTGNQGALAYLQQSTRPEVWAQRGAMGIAPFQASTSERDVDFSKQAILGLALSGRPEAAQTLRAIQDPALADLASEALKEHQKIASEGLASYDQTNRR
ncbi:hypothetical protein FJ492_00460 [Mesorhizobium sp. B2-5-4]|uniref:HEAT repeat domain-containing protein n=1 Tax=Mesorhizobium sp. B2-5-4 TaxID=2589926 RepID=UPI00116C2C4D|nr:hypothetical protein [Mesorhizobium sp. B2-5-4]TPK49604.1 hypothetical protein FJ492_00460 [Mesorhizobium sp. B2-5-4]